jgi:molybdopterin converting factor small subunit
MATIRLPTPLRPYAAGQTDVTVAGSTVSEALDNLLAGHPALRAHLLDGQGNLRPFVNLFIGEDNVADLEGLATPIDEGARLLLIPSIAGG